MIFTDWDWNWDHFKETIKQWWHDTWDWDMSNPYIEGEPFFFGSLFAVISLTMVVRALADATWIVEVPARPIPKSWQFKSLVEAGVPETSLLYVALIFGLATWGSIMFRSSETKVVLVSKLATCFLAMTVVLLVVTLTVWHLTHPLPTVPWWYATGYFALCEGLGLAVLGLICFLVDWLYLAFPSGSLTIARRKLIIATLLAMTCMIIGALIFEKLEPWDFPTAFQWMIITSITIGYGHIVVESTGGRIFLFIYGPIGIFIIGYFLFTIRDNIQESSNERMRRTVVKRRLSLSITASMNPNTALMMNRKLSLTRDTLRRSAAPSDGPDTPSRPGSVVDVAPPPAITFSPPTVRRDEDEQQVSRWLSSIEATDDSLKPISILRPSSTPPDVPPSVSFGDPAPLNASVSFGDASPVITSVSFDQPSIPFPDQSNSPRISMESSRFSDDLPPQSILATDSRSVRTGTVGFGDEGNGIPLGNIGTLGRTITIDPALVLTAEDEEKIRYHVQIWSVIRMTALWLFAWFIGSLIFNQLEPDWTYMDSLYFSWSTLTTVGYGDFVPTSPSSWEFWFWYVFLEVAVFAYIIALAGELVATKVHARFQRTLTREVTRQSVLPAVAGIPKPGEAEFEQEYSDVPDDVSRSQSPQEELSLQPVTSGELRLEALRRRNLGLDGEMV